MKTENVILMRQAREALAGNWGIAIGTFVVYAIVIFGIEFIPIAGPIAVFLIGGPMALGLTIFALSLSRKRTGELSQIFDGFRNFGRAFGACFMVGLFTFLWALLLIVPGIIAAISYSQTFFIIADDDNIGVMDAIDKSKQMMDGYKAKYFRLCLRFFGLSLLCILTLGIGFLWLYPYMYVTNAKFYDDLKGDVTMSSNAGMLDSDFIGDTTPTA